MIIIFASLILLAAIPMLLTIWRMRKAAYIKKNGIPTESVVTNIRKMYGRAGVSVDILTFEYRDKGSGKPYYGSASIATGKYKIGDTMQVTYLPEKPSRYAIDTKGGYTGILIFCIILFLFAIFAVYKLNGMVNSHQP